MDTLEATVTPDNADNKEVIWESSDTSVITVTENGLVKAVGVGSAEIICTANDGSGTATTCKVTVNPAEPKLMKAVSAGYDRVTITWNKVKDVTGYAVYQKEGNRWKKVRIVNSEMNSYTVKGLTCGKDYTFTVKAYSKVNGEIYKSKYNKKGITGKPIPSTPSIRYLKSYESGIKVAWRPVAGASGYIVYRQIGPNSWKRIARIDDGSAGSYFDRKVRNGKNYTYTLRAYKRVGKKNIYSNYDRTGKTVKK